MKIEELKVECALRSLMEGHVAGESSSRHTKNTLQSRLKGYTKTRVRQLQSEALLHKRVKRVSAKYPFLPPRLPNVNVYVYVYVYAPSVLGGGVWVQSRGT
jgi:hypothetical protein